MQMTHEEAFLQSIRERPDDDAPRLIYADWLEEHGQAERAEFIRVQCKMEQHPTWSARHRELDRSARQLWEKIKNDCEKEIPQFLQDERYFKDHNLRYERFKRGFFAEAYVGMRNFIDRGAEIITNTPARHITIVNSNGVLTDKEVSDCPYWQCLSALSFLDTGQDIQYVMPAIGAATHLRSLKVEGGAAALADEGIGGLIRMPHIKNLETLELPHQQLGVGLIPLAHAKSLKNLKSLNLEENFLDEAVSRPFFYPQRFQLQALDSLTIGSPSIHDDDINHMLGAPLTKLQSLRIGDSEHNMEDIISVLATSGKLSGLRHLDIVISGMDKEALTPLAHSTTLSSLECLEGIPERLVKPMLEEINEARRKGIRALPNLQFLAIARFAPRGEYVPLAELAKVNGMEMVAVPPEMPVLSKKGHRRINKTGGGSDLPAR